MFTRRPPDEQIHGNKEDNVCGSRQKTFGRLSREIRPCHGTGGGRWQSWQSSLSLSLPNESR